MIFQNSKFIYKSLLFKIMTYVWRNEAATNMFKKIVTPLRTLANEKIVQRIRYESFRCYDVAVAFLAIRESGYAERLQADS